MHLRSILVCSLMLGGPVAVQAQGTLSTQGFGYPAGQISSRALATGGAIAEFDPFSSTNPAAVSSFGGPILYFQAEPEYRSLQVGGSAERAMIARHPLVVAAMPVRPTLLVGLSFSNLLDRSFETNQRGTQQVGDSSLATTNFFKSDGAMADVRVALSWVPRSWLRLGLAGHVITGDNRLRNTQHFDDSARFAPIIDTSTVTYLGSAVSAGVTVFAGRTAGVAASFRKGGPLTAKRGDATLSRAHVPDRLAFSAAFVGIRGTSIAARTSKEMWSQMRGLGSASLPISEGWDTSVGADVLGPRVGQRFVQIRGGYRWRVLPFGLAQSEVNERSASFGLGTLFGRGRIGVDLTGIRATREPVASTVDLRETAWTMSIGVSVRP